MLLLCSGIAAQGPVPSPRPPDAGAAAPIGAALLSRVIANQQTAIRRLGQHCFRQDFLQETLNDDDEVSRREVRDELVCHHEGVPVIRHMAINGRPTGHREDEPWPLIRKDGDWQKQVRRAAERRDRFLEVIAEAPKAFNFSTVGRENVSGIQTTIYRLTPKPGYKARSIATEMLKHVSARAWVDHESGQMVRLQAAVDDDFNMWGGLVFKVRKGATYEMRQRPVNGTWLPWYSEERWHARIGLVKHQGLHQRAQRKDFRPAAEVLK